MGFKHYELDGAQIAVELCNSRDLSARTVEDILRSHSVDRCRARAGEIPQLRRWLEDLRSVFEADTPPERLARINDLIAEAGCVPSLVAHDELPAHLHFDRGDPALPARLRTITAGGLAVAIAVLGQERLGSCARSVCDRVYIDTSRSGRREFCSVRCANATRVKRHRAQSKEPASSAARRRLEVSSG